MTTIGWAVSAGIGFVGVPLAIGALIRQGGSTSERRPPVRIPTSRRAA